MKSAFESKFVARRVLACAAVAIVAAAPAAWAQNSQRSDEGTGAPNPSMDMSTPGTNGNTAAPPSAGTQRHGAKHGMRSHSGSAGHVKPGGGPNGAGEGGSGATGGGSGGAGGSGGMGAGNGGSAGSGGGAGSGGSSGY
ncbi:hypothetical protein FCJ61_39860 [Burkholderia metallica]|uniref:hypothetical protein n=1 Tax=Burkholderia metallica TaxID=488729 RepID=UPI00157B44AD|nr:hypothetical protein [Burkholderia metallica]NTZ88972.1 hypothetical protein [Burkholderia metallica]